jgi:hypothetical protein
MMGDGFIAAMGRPDPATPSGLPFRAAFRQMLWESIHEEIGAGFFRDRFLYLFGKGLQTLRPCLKAWSFLVPPAGQSGMIVGRNAYGALLVLEKPNSIGPTSRVHILDPVSVTYGGDPDLDFGGLIGYWLANRALPEFLDDNLYQKWRQREKRHLAPDEILGVKVPPGLGGKLNLTNFQPEKIIRYYETTGPIYAKAYGKAQQRGKSTGGKGKATKRETKKNKRR